MPELEHLAARHGLWLVEDAAHAHGSSFNGTMAGAFGAAAGFSFYDEGHDVRRRRNDHDRR
jgi:dTDP-4-amino-4,6-dideoxygalactose transaminase